MDCFGVFVVIMCSDDKFIVGDDLFMIIGCDCKVYVFNCDFVYCDVYMFGVV